MAVEEDKKLQQDVAETKQAVALLNQFNIEVVKPALTDMKTLLENTPSRAEFADLDKRVLKIEKLQEGQDNKYITRREVYAIVGVVSFIGVVLGVVMTIINLAGK